MYLPPGFKAFGYNPPWGDLKNTKRFGACHSMAFLLFILSPIFSKWITNFALCTYFKECNFFIHAHVHKYTCFLVGDVFIYCFPRWLKY